MELIVVIAAVSILAGIMAPTILHQVKEAKQKTCAAEMENLRTAIIGYSRDVGFHPEVVGTPSPTEIAQGTFPPAYPAGGAYTSVLGDELVIADQDNPWNPTLEEGWNGPYIDPGTTVTVDADGDGDMDTAYAFRLDSWDRFYLYVNYVENDTRSVLLYSGGPDRTLLTNDDLFLPIYAGSLF